MFQHKGGLVFASIFLILYSAQPSAAACPSGKVEDYAFCCCKKIFIITPSSSYSSSVMSATMVVANSSTSSNSTMAISSSASVASSPLISATPSNSVHASLVHATPTPIYRGDACFHTEERYGYYNECYCNHTRYNYVGFNNSNGYYTTDENATGFDFKCWNLPKPKLYIGGLFDSTELGKKIMLAADYAIEEVNKNEAVLPGYELVVLKENSTKHWISTGSGVLLDYLNQSPKKVAILGPDDDDLAKTVAAITGLPRYKLLQISYGTSAIDLSTNHDTFYPYFFRTKPFLDLLYNAARVQMLNDYKWGKVGLIYSNDAYHTELNTNLRSQIQQAKIQINIEEEFVTDPWSSMEHLKRKDVHVILGSFSGGDASRILCAAYKLKMYGPRYVYLFIGYTYLSGVDGCTLEQVKCAARYQFFFNHKPTECAHHFPANFTIRLNETFFNTSTDPVATSSQLDYAKYTYDAVHVIANVLHNVDTDKGNSSRFYSNYVYGSDKYGAELKKEVLKYDQCGASHNVSFGKDGNRYFKINVIQMRFGGGDLIVGDYDNRRSSNLLQIPWVKWPGNNEPYREIESKLNWRYVSKGLYIAYCVFAGFGILFAIFCLVVLLWRRKHKEIRYSFYLMNIVIIIGCILVYISVFLFGVDNVISPILTVDRVCRARLWVFSIGFALVLGGLIAKLWLAQDVLSRRLLMDKKKRRRMMFAIAFVILVITIIILLCWHFINPLKRVIEYIRDEVNFPCDVDIWPDNPFTLKLTAVEQCKCSNELIWYFVIGIWKAILIFIAVYWAYQTRDVFIPTINDTQRCGICAYVIAVCVVIGFIIAMATRLLPDVFFGLVGLIIIGCVTAVLIILFLHKIFLVFSCTRNRVIVKSATEEEDDINCFSRCFSKCNCFSSMCGCCTRCCKGNCPKCFLCLAVCCAPLLACCAPFLACFSALFACCGSSCRNCCCGSKSQRNGTDKAGEQRFIVKGIGDDKSAELARLQRELDMKNKYIAQMKRTDFPAARPIWTQTTEPVILLSDTCDDDSHDDNDDNAAAGDGKGKGRKKKKRRFRILNNKMDFSHVKSKTDSNFKNGGNVSVVGGKPGGKDGNTPNFGDKDSGNIPLVYLNSGSPRDNDDEIAKLKKLLADRDAELDRLKYGLGKKKEFDMPEIDESVENDMKRGVEQPPGVVIVKSDDGIRNKGFDGGCKKPSDDDDLDALLKELDTEDTPRGGYERNRKKTKMHGKKLDWSQIPSKLRSAGMISHDRAPGSVGELDKSPARTNKVSPGQANSSGSLSGPASLEPQANGGSLSYQRRSSNFKIFNERIDYSKIKSKIKPMLYNDMTRGSLSSSDNGSVKVLNGPSEYNRKPRGTPSTSNVSLNKPDAPRDGAVSGQIVDKPKEVKPSLNSNPANGSSPNDHENLPVEKPKSDSKDPKVVPENHAPAAPLVTLTDPLSDKEPSDKSKSDVKILNDPKDYSHVRSKLIPDAPTKPNPEKSGNVSPQPSPKSDVKILNDPRDYSHVRSKLIPDAPTKPNPEKSGNVSPQPSPKSDVKILNDPRDYSHVRSKLIPDAPTKPNPEKSGDASPRDKPKSDVKILNDPKDYKHVKSKLIPDPPARPDSEKSGDTSPRDKPKSDVKILNDPKDYKHVKSKLIPDPPARPNPEKSGNASPRDKPKSDVKILNDPKDYKHVRSKLSVLGPPSEMKKSNVKIVNKPADYSHVKSKLP